MSKTPTVIASSSSRKAHGHPAKPSGWLVWLDYFPFTPLAVAAFVLAIAPPFMTPHLWERLGMLATGEPITTVDIVDLLFHSVLLILLFLKLLRVRELNRAAR